MASKCRVCGRILALNDTAWTCGPIFCSHKCGVEWAKDKYEEFEYKSTEDLTAKATAYFNDIAEEISREDYGASVKRWTTYSSSHDITTIYKSYYEGDVLLATEVTGFYFGQTDLAMTDKYDGETTAIFV